MNSDTNHPIHAGYPTTAPVSARRLTNWLAPLGSWISRLGQRGAGSVVVFSLPFLPGIVMADGMKSLNILAGIEALILGVTLPAVDGLITPVVVRKTRPVMR